MIDTERFRPRSTHAMRVGTDARSDEEDIVTAVEAPSQAELVRRAAELLPLLREHAGSNERNRRLDPAVVEAMADAGVFRLRTPARYGGFEADTRTLASVATELGRGDSAAAWVAQVYWIPTWMAGLFPDPVQDEVFATPDTRICGTLSPSATAAPVDGGWRISGRWGFISGAWDSHWQVVLAIAPTPEGGMAPIMGLVPMSDLTIVDDWHTSGLRGSGSVSTVADEVFVPADRVLPMGAVMIGQSASEHTANSAMYRAPLLGVAAATSVGMFLGAAKAAWESFFERLPERKLTYTGYESQAVAPVTHLQVAEAAVRIDQAEFHAHRVTGQVDSATGAPWSPAERGQARADIGSVAKLAKEAADILAGASGGSSIYDSVTIQRVSRDINAGSLHALIYPPTSYELYGSILCGQEPNSPYI